MSGTRVARWVIWIAVPVAAAVVAYRNRRVLVEAAGLMAQARLTWLLPGVGAIVVLNDDLYRVIAFWLPVAVTLVLWLQLRRRGARAA